MSKPVYKVMDSKGRVLIPRELRLAAGMCGGISWPFSSRKGRYPCVRWKLWRWGISHRKR